MTRFIAVILLVGGVISAVAVAQSNAPIPILPDSIRWASPPNVSGLQAAWVLGAEQKPGPYILRVKLAGGARIPPHTHPEERNITVLAGTVYVGFGETFDETRVVAVPTGAVYVAPANVPHYLWAKDGDAMYQEAGVGPTGTSFIKRAPKIGELAPDFKLPYATQEKIFTKPEEELTLSSQRGKNVILAFYPADWSGGCTKEVCTLRDTFAELAKLNATVLGISGDYVYSHQEWAKYHNLPFPLLSDHDHHVAKMYDSFREDAGFNRRTVYLMDKDGVVRYVNLDFKAGDSHDYDTLQKELERMKS